MPRNTTDRLHARARQRGRRAGTWPALTGRAPCLLALDEARRGSGVSRAAHSQPRARLVPLGQQAIEAKVLVGARS